MLDRRLPHALLAVGHLPLPRSLELSCGRADLDLAVFGRMRSDLRACWMLALAGGLWHVRLRPVAQQQHGDFDELAYMVFDWGAVHRDGVSELH